MKHSRRFEFLILIIAVLCSSSIYGQNQGIKETIRQNEARGATLLEDRDTRSSPNPGEGSMKEMMDEANRLAKLKRDHLKKENELLQQNVLPVSVQFKDQYKSLLKDEKIYLAKLNGNDCFDNKIVSVESLEKCQQRNSGNDLSIWGGGSFFSFRNRTNYNTQDGVWADIHFTGKNFIVGSATVQGFITELNQNSFEQIDLKTPELEYLTEYKPENSTSAFRKQKQDFKNGITVKDVKYSTGVPAKLNSTYVLRTIAYRYAKEKNTVDKREDLIVAFKVVGFEKDGSVIILCKTLKKQGVPFLS
jgi:hypothetical protein